MPSKLWRSGKGKQKSSGYKWKSIHSSWRMTLQAGRDLEVDCTPKVLPNSPDLIVFHTIALSVQTNKPDVNYAKKLPETSCTVFYSFYFTSFLKQLLPFRLHNLCSDEWRMDHLADLRSLCYTWNYYILQTPPKKQTNKKTSPSPKVLNLKALQDLST